MRIIDNTHDALQPVFLDVYRTHRDEIVAVAFSFRSYAEAFHASVQNANRIRSSRLAAARTATRLYRIRIKKLKLTGEKP